MNVKQINALRALIVVIVISVISLMAKIVVFLLDSLVGWRYWGVLGALSAFVLVAMFIYTSLRVNPANPPHKALLVFCGRRLEVVLKEGWVFLPLYPYVFDMIMVNVEKNNLDLPFQELRTPDGAKLSGKISITWSAGFSGESTQKEASALMQYLNSGGSSNGYPEQEKRGKDKVGDILADTAQDRLRVFFFSKDEGPATWEEAMGTSDGIAILLKAILGDELPRVPSDIPTGVWMRYFNSPQQSPLQYEKKWGKNWEKLDEVFNHLAPDKQQALREAVDQRKKDVAAARQGNGYFKKRDLGITIHRLTIDELKLEGKVAETAEQAKAQVQQKTADEIAVGNLIERVEQLTRSLKLDPNIALTAVQVQTGKAERKVTEKIITFPLGVSPTNLNVV